MANVNVTISSIGDLGTGKGGERSRSAEYAAGTGNPAWAVVGNEGDIDVGQAPAAGPGVNLVFTLPSGFTFHSTAPFTPASGDFAVVSGAGTATLTVSDTNSDGTLGTEHGYTLMLSDDTTLDPMVINR